MRIAIFTDSYHPQVNGVINCIDSIKHEFEKAGNDVIVIAPTGTCSKFHSIKVPFYREYKHAIFPHIKCLRLLRKFKPDIIHAQTPFSMGVAAVVASRIYKVPLVSTFHTHIPEYFSYYFFDSKITKNAIWKYLVHYYKRSDAVTTPSEIVKKELEKRMKKRIRLIKNGVDSDYFTPENRSENFWKRFGIRGKKVILHVGRLSRERSIDEIVENIGKLVSERNDAALAIVGRGPVEKELKDAAKKFKGKIIFTGYLTNEELAKAYASSYAFVISSRTDTYPLVLLESYASGLPAIGINSEGVSRLVKKNTGFLYNDKMQLVRQVERMLDDEKLRNRLSKSARKFAEKHSWTIIAEKYLELYKEVLDKRKAINA